MTDNQFRDYFSTQSSDYRKFRPAYPDELYQFLVGVSPASDCAWDCATGNGQAAAGLSRYFDQVIATDASSKQLAHAMPANNIDYQLASAECTQIADHSIDLVTVAQALHWFDIEAFYREVRRVLKDQGVIAIWSYNLLHVSSAIDQVVNYLYADILGDYWPAERRLIENNYRDIPFPFRTINAPAFSMQAQWGLDELAGYLQTWSAVQNYIAAQHKNPVQQLRAELEVAWGSVTDKKTIHWPLHLMLGQFQSN